MEGKVYICSWKKVGTKYQVWLKNNPRIKASSTDFEMADEMLWGKIMDLDGDGENVREYIPPAPEAQLSVKLLDVAIVSVTANNHDRITGEAGMLFSGGICPYCRTFLGKRTDVPLSIDGMPGGYDGGFVWQKPFQYFSGDFLKLLTARERSLFEWRPVGLPKRSRKEFFEVIPVKAIPQVVVKGMNFEPYQCPKCQSISAMHCFQKGTSIFQYVVRSSLPAKLPSCFAMGYPYNFRLCLTEKRWLEIAGQPGTRGLVSNKVGVIADADCEANPKFLKHPGW